jgi:hypothetical protein
MRDKWDSPRGNGTYGSQLIGKALSAVAPQQEQQVSCQEQYLS